MDVLITAGATRNPVDAIRVLTANASGRTGVAIARRLIDGGVRVHLLGSPLAALRARDVAGLTVEEYGSTLDLMARMERWVRAHPAGALVHSSAVGDYQLAGDLARKLPSQQSQVVLRLSPAPKIADRVRSWGLSGHYVTFKAASPEVSDSGLLTLARDQRTRTGCDQVFANVLGRLDHSVTLVDERVRRFEERAAAIDALCADVLGPNGG